MKYVYEISGISKQSHYQYMKRRKLEDAKEELVVSSILEVRTMHTMMGLKKIYMLLQPEMVGRDHFIEIGMAYGLGIKIARSYQRTTFSTKSAWFINLASGIEIKGINRVWVSDITYYRLGDTFYYLTFIVDVYSRRILGYEASTSLHAEANCKALRAAIKERSGSNLDRLIHHSDRGSQYISDKYLKILSDNGIAVSMCNSVYENTHMERVNGIIKNEYLNVNQKIKTFNDLKKYLKRAVDLYNGERPHWSLGAISPISYEEKIRNIEICNRESLTLYSENSNYYIQQTLFD
jgi:transposase InsO family protein